MNNLKILLKNNINLMLGKLQGKRKRKSTYTAIFLLVLGIIGIYGLYFFQSWSLFYNLIGMGFGKLCVFHGIVTTITVLFAIAIMRVTGKTKGNDTDFLLSLPIKKRDIIISKISSQYIFDLFFSFALLSPFIILYEIYSPFSVSIIIFSLITIILLPFLSVGISQIMEYIVVRFFNRWKYGNVLKTLIPTALYLSLITLMIVKTSGYGLVQFENLDNYFQDRWLANKVLEFIFNQSLISILSVVGITILTAVFGIILKINTYGKNYGVYVSRNDKIELKQKESPYIRLFKKEIKSYFLNPAYLLNTIIGPILIIVSAVAISIIGVQNVLATFQLSIPYNELQFIFILIINFFISTTCISAVSLSLEGKNVWLIRSMPISAFQIFLSKLLVPVVIILPTLIFSAIVYSIILENILYGLIIFAIALLFLLLTDIIGLMINLWFPKLNWESETQVIKQSLSVLLSMVFNFILVIIPIVLYLVFKISIIAVALISIGIYISILILFICLLFSVGKKLLKKLN